MITKNTSSREKKLDVLGFEYKIPVFPWKKYKFVFKKRGWGERREKKSHFYITAFQKYSIYLNVKIQSQNKNESKLSDSLL